MLKNEITLVKFNPLSHYFLRLGQFACILLSFAIPTSTAVTTIAVALIAISWIAPYDITAKKNILLFHPLVKWLYPFLAFALIGISYSSAESREIHKALICIIRLFLIPILIYFFQDRAVRQYALNVFLLAMITTLVLAFLKMYAGLPISLKYEAGAIFKNYIESSFLMSMAVFLLAIKFLESPQKNKPILILIALMVYYLLFMNQGRVGYLSLGIMVLFLAWQYLKFRGALIALVMLSVLMGSAYVLNGRFANRINHLAIDYELYKKGGVALIDSSLGLRLQFIKKSVHIIAQKPFIGNGTGSFSKIYQENLNPNEIVTTNPHNQYLWIGVELGLLGLLLLSIFFYQQWQLANYLNKTTRQLFQGFLIIFLVGCIANSWLRDFAEIYFFVLMSALCLGRLHPQKVGKEAIT